MQRWIASVLVVALCAAVAAATAATAIDENSPRFRAVLAEISAQVEEQLGAEKESESSNPLLGPAPAIVPPPLGSPYQPVEERFKVGGRARLLAGLCFACVRAFEPGRQCVRR
jgi:hypothetical protein